MDIGDNLQFRGSRMAALVNVKGVLPPGEKEFGAAMRLIFVFMLASGTLSYQPQSEENCAKLATAFAKGEKVAAMIEGKEVPILQGVCIRADKASNLEQLLSTVHMVPSS